MKGLGQFLAQPVPMLSALDGGGYLNGLHYQSTRCVYVPFFGITPIIEQGSIEYAPTEDYGIFHRRDLASVLRYMLFMKEASLVYVVDDGRGQTRRETIAITCDPAIRDARSAWFFRAPSLMSTPDATGLGQSTSPLWDKGGHLIGSDGRQSSYDAHVKALHYDGMGPGEFYFFINTGLWAPGSVVDYTVTYFD